MLLKPLAIVAAGLAATTSAFLLPPGALSDERTDETKFNILPFEVAKTAESQLVKVDCHDCSVRVPSILYKAWMKHQSSHVELSFTIDHAASSDRLLVNGFELYPNTDPFAHKLTAPLVLDFGDEAGKSLDDDQLKQVPDSLQVSKQQLGFSLLSSTTVKDEANRAEIVTLDFQVLEVGNHFVRDMNIVHIEVMKLDGGSLMIARIEQVSNEESTPSKPKDKCTSLACRWKALVDEYVAHLKPAMGHCAGKMAGKMGHMGGPMGGHKGHHGSQHHSSGHGNHHMNGMDHEAEPHRMHHHSWARLFKKFNYTILIPILVGIVAGITVSIIGMVVGTLIIGLWRVFVRGQPFFRAHCRRRAGSRCHKAAQQEVAFAEEKSGLIDNEDAPPLYSDEEEAELGA